MENARDFRGTCPSWPSVEQSLCSLLAASGAPSFWSPRVVERRGAPAPPLRGGQRALSLPNTAQEALGSGGWPATVAGGSAARFRRSKFSHSCLQPVLQNPAGCLGPCVLLGISSSLAALRTHLLSEGSWELGSVSRGRRAEGRNNLLEAPGFYL